jgi:hypothetical protein
MRSYQILTIIGSLFVIYDLIFAARQLSISVLIMNVFAIVFMFIFKNNTKSIGIGLIVLSVVMLYSIGNFGVLRLRYLEMALFVVGAITALMYKSQHAY